MTTEIRIGSLVFEYDPKTRYLGVGNGEELFGTAEVSEEVWEGFADAAEGKDVPEAGDGERLTVYVCPGESCRYFSMTPGQCRSHPYPLRAMGPAMEKVTAVVVEREPDEQAIPRAPEDS